VLILGVLIAAFSIVASAPVASPTPAVYAAPQINARGVFQDRAAWMYIDATGARSISAQYEGTNEFLQMPPASPPPGGAVTGVEILRHPSDHMGYPIHISLVEKTFAQLEHLQSVYVADSPSSLYRYDVASSIWNQHTVRGDDDGKGIVNAVGPISATAPIPDAYRRAFNLAKNSLASVTNLPESQKELANYDVSFVETEDATWVEFGPHFGLGETAHLGCQTRLGRDMVFGFMKVLAGGESALKFLQCF
jgi:hypothetical protein